MRFTEQAITSLEPCSRFESRDTFHLSYGEKFTEEEIQVIKNLLKNKKFHFSCYYNGVMVNKIEKY